MPPCIWHLRHLRMNSLVSSYIVGQKKPLCQIFAWVLNAPLWPPYAAMWNFLMICMAFVVGTHHLSRPSDHTLYKYMSSKRCRRLPKMSFFLFSPGGTYPETIKFTIFAYHGVESVTFRSMSSHRKSFIGGPCRLVTCIRDRWSATVFSSPFLSFISRSNSWSKRIHLIRRGLASFFGEQEF